MNPVPVNSPADAYKRYGPALVRKATRVLRNEDDAMDIVQTLFVDLIARPPKSLELAYLYSAVTNRCLNLLRNESLRSRLIANAQVSPPVRTSLGAPMLSPMLSLELLLKLVNELDSKSAAIVVYHFIDDLSQEEVAKLMQMSRRAVVKRLAKIRVLARALSRAASHTDSDDSGAAA